MVRARPKETSAGVRSLPDRVHRQDARAGGALRAATRRRSMIRLMAAWIRASSVSGPRCSGAPACASATATPRFSQTCCRRTQLPKRRLMRRAPRPVPDSIAPAAAGARPRECWIRGPIAALVGFSRTVLRVDDRRCQTQFGRASRAESDTALAERGRKALSVARIFSRPRDLAGPVYKVDAVVLPSGTSTVRRRRSVGGPLPGGHRRREAGR